MRLTVWIQFKKSFLIFFFLARERVGEQRWPPPGANWFWADDSSLIHVQRKFICRRTQKHPVCLEKEHRISSLQWPICAKLSQGDLLRLTVRRCEEAVFRDLKSGSEESSLDRRNVIPRLGREINITLILIVGDEVIIDQSVKGFRSKYFSCFTLRILG